MSQASLLPDPSDLWQACTEKLAQVIPEQQFNTWIRPLGARVSDSGDKVTLAVANRFKMDWIRAQYSGKISAMLETVAGRQVALELALAPREVVARSMPPSANRGPTGNPTSIFVELPEAPEPEPKVEPHKHRLNTTLNFATLVEGSANRMARAAALHVAHHPGQLYNPLFIYGGVGLGKTHLMHAIGNQLLADKPGAKVLYIHAEQFVSHVVKSYQKKTFDEFKQRYHSLDLLLIDDVQFFANKERTQEIGRAHV